MAHHHAAVDVSASQTGSSIASRPYRADCLWFAWVALAFVVLVHNWATTRLLSNTTPISEPQDGMILPPGNDILEIRPPSLNNNSLVNSTRESYHMRSRALPPANGSKVFANFLVHIPKSGGNFVLKMLRRLTMTSPQWKDWKNKTNSPYMPCNQARRHPRHFTERYPHKMTDPFIGTERNICTLWMSEHNYTPNATHNYIVVRDPRPHVLSQYFHCTESKPHRRKAWKMPDLTTWLEAWVAAKSNSTIVQHNKRFGCYNPIDMASRMALFRPEDSAESLRNKFLVVGDSSQMTRTVCAIAIEYNGFVPKACNCTKVPDKMSQVLPAAPETYNLTVSSHGVKHHGDTYNTTHYQDELIAQLTTTDSLLYQHVRQLLGEKVEELERNYKVHICNTLR